MPNLAISQHTKFYRFWPVQRSELKKVIPLLVLKFLISVMYSFLFCMKDTPIITGSDTGVEMIPILKGSISFPLSICIALLYAKLAKHFQRSTIFYGTIVCFLFIIVAYGFVLYPQATTFIPHRSADWLTARLGVRYLHWIAVYRYWMHALFFVTAEMWGQVVIILLYWEFVNHICLIEEAKRIYTLLIAAGDIAPMVVGPIVVFYVHKYTHFTPTLQALVIYMVITGLLIIAAYWWIHRYVWTEPIPISPHAPLQKKHYFSMMQLIQHIGSSRYLLSMAIIIMGCAFSTNVLDVSWKAHLKTYYPTPAAYQAFMGKVNSITGLTALLTTFFLGGSFLRKWGWHFSAQISPILIGTTGAIFFTMSCFSNYLGTLTSHIGYSPLLFLVIFGAFQSILNKTVKYSFFDPTKEIAYIPLNQETKKQGKAALDIVGSRLGKASASWLQILLLELVSKDGSIGSITPFLLCALLVATGYWSYATYIIHKKLQTNINHNVIE